MSFKVSHSGLDKLTKSAGRTAVNVVRVDKFILKPAAKKAAKIMKAELRKAAGKRKETKLSKAVRKMTGKKNRPMGQALASSVSVQLSKNAVFIGVVGKMAKHAERLDTGSKSASINVSDKMRRFFMALYVKGLINAPMASSKTTIKIPAKSGTNWRKKVLPKVTKVLKENVEKLIKKSLSG